MINENQILLGNLSIELNPFAPLPNGRIREIHLGSEQIKIAKPNSNNKFPVGHFNSNVNFEQLHNIAQFAMGNEQIVQIHPNKNHLFHLQCINSWFIEQDKMECPVCRFKHNPKTLKFLPLLSENKQNEEHQNVLFLNYHQILEQILAEEKSGTFKHRQAKGALIGFEKHIENLNMKIKQIFESNEHKLQMQNGKIVPNDSIKTMKIMLKQILAIERGESSRNLLQELENVNSVLANIAKEAFDAIEMISEKDEE
uniref:RING-type domain-containing protein n=1 Tax=Globodera rostochiensis TaxID=31243 RepID=A0A914I0J4_GLORO